MVDKISADNFPRVFDEAGFARVERIISPYGLSALLVRNGFYIELLRKIYEGWYEEYMLGCDSAGLEREDFDSYMIDFNCSSTIGGTVESGDVGLLMGLEYTFKAVVEKIAHICVLKHISILLRKEAQLKIKDDYGRIDASEWDRELDYFAKNIVIPAVSERLNFYEDEVMENIYRYWELGDPILLQGVLETIVSEVSFFINVRKPEFADTSRANNLISVEFDGVLNGHDYESRVAELFNLLGWNSRVTPKTGDNGADIIAEKNGVVIVVQCKFYSSPVGNKSVQEIYSAKGYYDGGHACVVTNLSYTPAAKSVAAKLGVALLHHEQVKEYLESF